MTRPAGPPAPVPATEPRTDPDGKERRETGRVLEVVRFRAEPSREDEFLARRPAAIKAMREGAPGFVAARLGRVGDGAWVHVVEWENREKAVEGGERAMGLPAVQEWVGHIGELTSLEHADVEQEDGEFG